jgi:GT2 family glycosyltransferase
MRYWIEDRYPELTFLRFPENRGFVSGANAGTALALLADSEYILHLNNDTEIPAGDYEWLDRLSEPLQADPRVGAVGAVSNRIYGHQRRNAPNPFPAPRWKEDNVLTGFCLLLRKAAVQEVGLFDEQFSPGNYDDFDYSLRLTQAGWKLAIAESVWIHHAMHATFKTLQKAEEYDALLRTNRDKLLAKWGEAGLKKVGLENG